jgi:hypothetical protein
MAMATWLKTTHADCVSKREEYVDQRLSLSLYIYLCHSNENDCE